jgi:hypothetical protein
VCARLLSAVGLAAGVHGFLLQISACTLAVLTAAGVCAATRIDEIHTLVGAGAVGRGGRGGGGGGGGGLDISNMLKPALARGELQVRRRHGAVGGGRRSAQGDRAGCRSRQRRREADGAARLLIGKRR